MTLKEAPSSWQPAEIRVLRRVKDSPRTKRILRAFPSASVCLVDRQQGTLFPDSDEPEPRASKRRLLIGATSSYLRTVEKSERKGLVCFSYRKLVPFSNGCPFRCVYCYLVMNYLKYMPYMKMNVNWERMFDELGRDLFGVDRPVPYNMGEMLDSLALADASGILEELVPFFAAQSHGRLMLLSKSDAADSLLGLEHAGHTTVSWSLNPQSIIDRYELGASSLEERLRAARRVSDAGYPIRFRIDPGIMEEGWEKEYESLVEAIWDHGLQPENITLGTLRLSRWHYSAVGPDAAKVLRGAGALCDSRGERYGRLRYPLDKRLGFYRSLIGAIRRTSVSVPISVCWETKQVFAALRGEISPFCNCRYQSA